MFNLIWGKKHSRKEVKRQTLAKSRIQGKLAEERYKLRAGLAGYEVVRTGKGHDFKIYKNDIITGKRRFAGYREIKSGNAKTSPLQNKTKKRLRNYKVIREPRGFW